MSKKEFLMKKNVRLFLSTSLLFFSIFSIHFQGVPEFLTPRILSMFILIFFFMGNKVINLHKETFSVTKILWIFSTIFIVIYSFIVTYFSKVDASNATIVSSTLNFLIFVGIFPFFMEKIFVDSKNFATCLLYSSLAQAVIVIFSFIFPGFRVFLEKIQVMEFWRYDWRVIGLGIAGAGGSIYLFVGIIAAGFLIISGELNFKNLTFMFVITISILLVGRTGFYAALALITYIVFFNSNNFVKNFKNAIKIFGFLLIGVLFFFMILCITPNFNFDMLVYTLNRAFELFEYGFDSPTLSGINNVEIPIPGISLETLFGTGVSRGLTSSGKLFMSDSGYIQRYASLGLIVAIISYVSFAIFIMQLIKNIDSSKRRYIVFCLLLLFIIEYKEPFMYMLAYPFTLVMFSVITKREAENGKSISKCMYDNIQP